MVTANPGGYDGFGCAWAGARMIQISNDFRGVYGSEMPGNGTLDCRIRPLLEWQSGGGGEAGMLPLPLAVLQHQQLRDARASQLLPLGRRRRFLLRQQRHG